VQVVACLKQQVFYKNQEIIREGEPGSSFYLIKEAVYFYFKKFKEYKIK
jgi:hypothetical protein